MKQTIRTILCLLFCQWNLLFMHYNIILTCEPYDLDWTSYVDNSIGCMIDVIIVMVIFKLITLGRTKLAILLTFLTTLLWAFCNIVYARFFHSYLMLSAVGQGVAMIDPLVFKSTIHGLKITDIIFIIWPVLFISLYRKLNTSNNVRKHFTSALIFISGILLFDTIIHLAYCLSSPDFRHIGYYLHRLDTRHLSIGALCEPSKTTFHRGVLRTLMAEAYDNTRGPILLSESQKRSIHNASNEAMESMIQQHRDKIHYDNIIFIIVESYMSFTADLIVDGKEITPFMNQLRKDSTVYYNGKVQPNITLGESSDGQYIYMTGLLPLRSAMTITKAHNKVLPALPKLFAQEGMHTKMIIPTQPSIWNQSAMCRQYGIEELYSSNDYKSEHETDLNDRQLFELAKQTDKNMKKDFFSVILTLSMHQPYTHPIDPSFKLNAPQMTNELRNYLNACHYTDKHIGDYLLHLKESGLYDNSLIVIAADHHVHTADFGEGISDDISLFIINGGIDNNTAWHGACNQIDIYTTLLDILRIHSSWYGLGHSLLSPGYKNSLSNEKWNLSEWILLSDFFNPMR